MEELSEEIPLKENNNLFQGIDTIIVRLSDVRKSKQ
jgi:hypothetical protein